MCARVFRGWYCPCMAYTTVRYVVGEWAVKRVEFRFNV